MRMAGKIALITGASTGIGAAAARLFAEEGAKVIIADIHDESGEAIAAEIRSRGQHADYMHCDMTEEDSVSHCIKDIVARYGQLNVLYNNVGGSTPADGPVTTVAIDEFWRALRLDLFTTFLGSRHAIPAMIDSGGGSIINTTSYTAMLGVAGRDCYTAAKGAVISLTRSMAVEFAPHKIRVNAVSPGAVDTERLRSFLRNNPSHPTFDPRNRHRRPDVASHLMGLVQPDDVAATALFLASDESARITGTIVSVDSGATAW